VADVTKGGDSGGRAGTCILSDQQDRKGKSISYSTPPKGGAPKISTGSKFMGDAQKAYRKGMDDEGLNKVHIPESFEEPDTKSESLSDKLRKIGAYREDKQRCSKDTSTQYHQKMFFMSSSMDVTPENVVCDQTKDDVNENLVSPHVNTNNVRTETLPSITTSPEVLSDDHIINTQESMAFEENTVILTAQQQVETTDQDANGGTKTQEKRRSERLKKDITMMT